MTEHRRALVLGLPGSLHMSDGVREVPCHVCGAIVTADSFETTRRDLIIIPKRDASLFLSSKHATSRRIIVKIKMVHALKNMMYFFVGAGRVWVCRRKQCRARQTKPRSRDSMVLISYKTSFGPLVCATCKRV